MNRDSKVVELSWSLNENIVKQERKIKNLRAIKYNLETCYDDYINGGVDDLMMDSVIKQTEILLNKKGYSL